MQVGLIRVAVGMSFAVAALSLVPAQQRNIEYINPDAPPVTLPSYRGVTYEARVPDTLDIAERAGLALHSLTAQTDPDSDYEIYWATQTNLSPGYMYHDWNDTVWCKFVEAAPLVRTASGSKEGLHVEQAWLDSLMKMQGPDGMFYFPVKGRPWFENNALSVMPADQFNLIYANGRFLNALTIYYLLTGNDVWKDKGQRVVDGLNKLVTHYEPDKARFDWYVYGPGREVDYTTIPGAAEATFSVHDETGARYIETDPKSIVHNMATWTVACVHGLSNYYRHTGYEPAAELATKLANWVIEDSGHFDAKSRFLNEPGVNRAHFHGHLMSVLAILECGLATDNDRFIAFSRKGFEFALTNGEPAIGYFHEWVGKGPNETCHVADMTHIAIKLSESGAADRWDYVDRWVRNTLTEQQLLDDTWLAKATEGKPPAEPHETTRISDAGKRLVGSFSYSAQPNAYWKGGFMTIGCCNGNASRALYYVWNHIARFENGNYRINLLLNHVSKTADIESYLPYEGKVVVRMKAAAKVSLRLPDWADSTEARGTVNGQARELVFQGRYAQFGSAAPGDVVEITFSMAESTLKTTIADVPYTFQFRGNTAIDVDPKAGQFPLYAREKYRGAVQTRVVSRYVPDTLVNW